MVDMLITFIGGVEGRVYSPHLKPFDSELRWECNTALLLYATTFSEWILIFVTPSC